MKTYDELKFYTDGGSRGNPGPAASGVVILTMEDEILEAFGEYWGETTNNQAEYRAIQLALEAIAKYQPKIVHGFMDSELAVRQLNGIYKVKNAEIKPIHTKILTLAAQYKTTFKHVYREQNKLADAQVNISIDRALGIRTD